MASRVKWRLCIWLDGPTKGKKNSVQNSRYPRWDLNPAPVEYEAGARALVLDY